MDGRNAQGQFVKGHQVSKGKGRPRRSIEEKYLKWMSARVKKADWDMITDTAIARAKSGDNVARQWLSDYLIGKPQQQLQVDVISDVNIILKWPEDADDHDSAPGAA